MDNIKIGDYVWVVQPRLSSIFGDGITEPHRLVYTIEARQMRVSDRNIATLAARAYPSAADAQALADEFFCREFDDLEAALDALAAVEGRSP